MNTTILTSEKNKPGDVLDLSISDKVKMPFCFIPPGSFTQTTNEDEDDNIDESDNAKKVIISTSFWLAKTPVTQAQWLAVMESNPSAFKGDNIPVETVSWNDAQSYIAKLNETRILPQGWKFALPTEAQWEYACRAGEDGTCLGGDEDTWNENNSNNQIHEVGRKKPNGWGLHDMLGNVCEWCADWCDDAMKGGTDPVGPSTGEVKVFRGGSWFSEASSCAANYRDGYDPDDYYDDLGFRIAIFSPAMLEHLDSSRQKEDERAGLLANAAEMLNSQIKDKKNLVDSHLRAQFDHYIVIGFSLERGEDQMTNCESEQFNRLFDIFIEAHELAKQQGNDFLEGMNRVSNDTVESPLGFIFDKYIALGLSLNRGAEYMTNCDANHFDLLTDLFKS